jgi:hypothetical protein
MPPPTSSQKPNKAVAKDAPAKAPAAAAATNGATNGAKEVDEKRGLTKPDQAKYNAEQDEINKEIAAVKAKMVSHPKKNARAWTDGIGRCEGSNPVNPSSRWKRQEKSDQG